MARFLILTPKPRDAELIVANLARVDLDAHICPGDGGLLDCLGDDTTAIITTEEMLRPAVVERLRQVIDQQPFWSELAIVVFISTDASARRTQQLDKLGPRANIMLLDRPIRIKALASIASGIARSRERQYQVRDLFGKLQEQVKERDRFLAILGHELRNPLGAIMLAAQLADGDGKLDAQHADRIERQAQHLSRLVDDLLDHARIATGKVTLKRSHTELNQLVEQCLRALPRTRYRRDVAVTFEASPEPLPLFADAIRIDQIISNLLTNALKYTPEGGRIVVRTSREDGMAKLSVEDTGVGIAANRIATIFDLFSQAENAIGRSEGGMGIGLNLVRTLVGLHDGTVSASSPGLNQGSAFVVKLPLATGDETAEDTHVRRSVFAQNDGEAKRIVVVDDNADIRDLLEIKLRKLGHEVWTAADGQTGLHRIMTERPDVAIVDIGMSGLDGYELARRVREELHDEVKLVALTGFGQAEDRELALSAGFDEHLVKPVRVDDLREILGSEVPSPRGAGRGSG